MNAAAIAALCRAAVDIEVVAETGSTNADLMGRAAQLARPTLLIAEHQSAGRGRAGRSWLSAPGDSLTFSLAWQFDGSPQQLLGLPLAVGVALAEALAALAVPVQLKWPNDVLKDGSKLAGILIETQGAPGGTWAVIGIGLNLSMPDRIEERIGRSIATAPWLARMERDALMAALTDALAAGMDQFAREGFGAFRARWDALHAWRGQPVAIVDQGAVLQQGVAAGVDDSGRLLLDTDGGRVAVLAGDVSLRLGES
ncbi:biotin--[acetyl-CoA-carboxylase] ligase [Massilia eurypsychrophila]|jgi:BirA family biotin operon repressor/biotin-[acetyl-CoA-carboxylase] ligase|uniref:biotin--[biotin carboxyl-carrier protein] ligase n=1 Tax=Massilia eurypsychrophila TaxID=1485217 RepID=A0A2G8TIM1_9BURK|nr:biotin--[acetyl-CoA-carboxylase] ligase [Massilia eurypsychrophila]PIL45478.1 biotin--[acetyl-CoA-carboxylase] ligase [Massilia eurypsychrophila]